MTESTVVVTTGGYCKYICTVLDSRGWCRRTTIRRCIEQPQNTPSSSYSYIMFFLVIFLVIFLGNYMGFSLGFFSHKSVRTDHSTCLLDAFTLYQLFMALCLAPTCNNQQGLGHPSTYLSQWPTFRSHFYSINKSPAPQTLQKTISHWQPRHQISRPAPSWTTTSQWAMIMIMHRPMPRGPHGDLSARVSTTRSRGWGA